ncbi:TonB-dependent receptor domain-containing protein [Pseudothauera hydrothermalis]|uniref:TonB-dependent receptor domain-containing protein n=1 Tax=Pseudothauera hydrothermalis TaxID=2184083 RepID=UPI000C7CF430|nr:TonB-dependent receptor [Pseudothauera hydrothermalis]AUM01033.1 TonB-dependent receptor [Rhodocyclaceae bacterium]
MKTCLSAAALTLAAALPCSVSAQASVEKIAEPVVVTATRQAQRADEVLASVEVIEREQIERAGQSTLIDLLRAVAGVRVASNGGPGSNASVFIRGAEARHALLLIDGVRVGSATTGQATLEAIPLAMVERIEVLRGPASALYGSEAIGGVIQVFTRKGRSGFDPQVFLGYGSDDTLEANASLSGGVERFRYSLTLGQDRTRGFDARSTGAHDPDRDGFRNAFVSANLALGLRERDEIGIDLYQSDGRNWYDANLSYNAYLDKRLDTVGVYAINQLAEGWRSTVRVARSRDRLDNRSSTAQASKFYTTQDQFSWQHDIDLPLGVLMAAFDYVKSQVDSTTAYTVDERTVKAWLLGWSAKAGAHSVQVNLRRDDNSQFGGKTTGLLAYGYDIDPAWSVRGSIATAFNAPTFNQLYWPDTGWGGGNPELEPERALNREIGLRWKDGRQSVEATYYDNKVRDLISGWPPVNVNEARLKGLELAYRVALGELDLQVGMDWLRARDEATGKRLARRARSAAFVKVDHRVGKWSYGIDLNGQGDRFDNASNSERLAGYGVVDAYVHYRLTPDWRVEMRANNVLDKQYELAKGYATAGASYFVGLRYAPR